MMKSGVSGARRRRVFRRDNYRCQKCGLVGWPSRCTSGSYVHPTAIDGVYLSIDHITPRSKGGSHDEENLRTLCTTCNTRKGAN